MKRSTKKEIAKRGLRVRPLIVPLFGKIGENQFVPLKDAGEKTL